MEEGGYGTRSALVSRIDGMLSPFSAALIDALSRFQSESHITGNALEFGSYKGKTAMVLGLNLTPDERLFLIDSVDYLERDIFVENEVRFEFFCERSGDIRPRKFNNLRLIHCDTSHTFADTRKELELSRKMLGKYGVIVVDDFTNLHYPGVLPAVYEFLLSRTDFSLFMVTNEKAYICKSRQIELYQTFVSTKLQDDMEKRGIRIVMARTDTSHYSKATYVRPALGDEPTIYAKEMYAHLWSN